MSFNHKSLRAALLISATAATLFAAGCGSDDSTHPRHASTPTTVTTTSVPASSVAQHNSADVMFNQMMIPHHSQALEMAALVDSRTTTPAVRQLAASIRTAQQPEIDQMTARLKAWGQPTEMSGGHGGHRMSGMMSDADMTELTAARGTEFDRKWLSMMVRHHEGAVAMADAELTDGVDAGSRTLAAAIKTAQLAEIARMNTLLGK
ncbi:DUF305 domain-containing protein [Gordonia asplenii]|nr:DUF305 domain-containing protein [Gordonia asplenii]